MFSKLALFVAAAFAVSAFAGEPAEGSTYGCNVGSLQCCKQLQAPDSAKGKEFIASLVTAPVQNLNGQVGAQCNPITFIGKGNGAGCSTAPTCCSSVGQSQQSLFGSIGVNCNPATVIT